MGLETLSSYLTKPQGHFPLCSKLSAYIYLTYAYLFFSFLFSFNNYQKVVLCLKGEYEWINLL